MSKQWPGVYRNLATMLGAGVDMRRTMEVAGKGLRGRERRGMEKAVWDVRNGTRLADALTHCGRSFTPLDKMVVEVGEESGALVESLSMLADWHEFNRRMRALMKSGLIYPVVLIHAVAILPGFLHALLGIIPLDVYLRHVATILAVFVWIPTAFVWALYRFWPQDGYLRHAADMVAHRIPLLGKGLRNAAISRFCRAFALGLRAGVPAPRCAEQATKAAAFWPVVRSVQGVAEAARRGEPFHQGFKPMPLGFIETWETGEEAGELDSIAQKLGQQYAESGEQKLRAWTWWFPRVIYFVIVILIAIQIVMMAMAVMGGVAAMG